ncbi:jg16920 [Pararge aegeria aegeria]|uniref:Jg16920 protein n=1 Tax=Pararge aegeria aegeria TaxID=348720 RepID=A0A8S4SPM9_9NEOP|nr:jg16920 [Pararge aegeria aegeria]
MPCYCKDAPKEQLIAVGGCSDDLAAVSALPDHWVPRHCSPTLTKYLKEREQNHEKILEHLLHDAARVNKDVDAKVRTIAETLLSLIKENQNDINSVIQNSQPDEGTLSVLGRSEALKEITKLFTSRIQDLTNFKQEALGLERLRADGIRGVFKSQFQRLIAVGHKTPKDLLHEFDDRIYEINQQLLSNSRAYIELEAQLRVQLDENIVHARSALNQLCLKQSQLDRGRSALPWVQEKQSISKRSDIDDRKSIKESEDFSQGVSVDIEEFKVCVSQLVQAYRNAMLKIFAEFSCQLGDLHKDIGFRNLKVDRKHSYEISLELENMIKRALKRISDSNVQVKVSIYKDLEEMTLNDLQHMQESLSSLGKCLLDTYTLLFDASHIWDDHILRSALVQKLTVAAVEDIQNIHDSMELANEIQFNIPLELLRYAPDEDKLQNNYEIAINLLQRIAVMNQNHSDDEIAKLEEYMNLPLIMANVLLAECDVFLENHPKTIVEPSGSLASAAGNGSPNPKSAFTLRAPLPRAILQTELQEVALNNWKNGFLDSFVYNLPAVSEELNRQARKWVDERSLQLNMRYSLKQMSHGIRSERVSAAREARLAELRFHEQRLKSHLDAMYERIDGLPLEASSFLALDAPELYPFCKWVKSIQTDMDDLLSRAPDPEIKRLKMISYAPRLVNHRDHFQKSLDVAMQRYKNNIEHEIQTARISNFKFMSQLKLFMEGGRYAAAEAAKSCAALVKAADALEICVNRCMNALNARRTQLLALADQQILPLQKVVEEVSKFDKKKPPANKKK